MKRIITFVLIGAFVLTILVAVPVLAKSNKMGPKNAGLGLEIMLKNKADALGITVDELQTLLNSGKKLIDIAAEKGLTQEQLCQKAQTQMQTKIQAMVSAGILTQAQADRWKTWAENKQEGNGNCMYQGFFGTRAMGKGLGRYYNLK